VESYSHTFSQSYHDLYWQVEAADNTGKRVVSAVTRFGLDFDAPTSQVTTIIRLDPIHYGLAWTGSDATSGISSYNIQYRLNGSPTWQTCWNATTLHSDTCAVPDTSVYWFRSQAVDFAGNQEPASNGDVSTAQALVLTRRHWLPLIAR